MANLINLDHISNHQLLSLKFKQLDLQLEGSIVDECLRQVMKELAQKKIFLPIQIWVSDEFFCADGTLAIAVPFYLLHPKLIRLEKFMMGKAEGSTKKECLKILRHEVGHVIDNAYNLRRCKKRKRLFGDSNKRYPRQYQPIHSSKNHVSYLGEAYATSHPDEDFAETFATWLDPASKWRTKYKNSGALEKLLYIDEKIKLARGKEITPKRVLEIDSIFGKRSTIRQYYQKKTKYYKKPTGKSYLNLNRIMHKGTGDDRINIPKASKILRAQRKEILRTLASQTNQYQYKIKGFVDEVIHVCEQRDLRYNKNIVKDEKLMLYLNRKLASYLKEGKDRVIM